MRRQPRVRARQRRGAARRAWGFTLVELLVVMTIIGIVLAFILSASLDAVRRSEERATQALLIKLDTALADRMDALLATRTDALPSHQYLAGIWAANQNWAQNVNPLPSNMRAQIIARLDQIKAEVPDVFYVQNDTNYLLNFAAVPYPGSQGYTSTAYDNYFLPMGVAVLNDPSGSTSGTNSFGGYPNAPNPYTVTTARAPASTGIMGASYTAAAGVYKGLFDAVQRVNPGLGSPNPRNAGFDGIDNNGNNLVDEITENDIGLATGTISGPMKALLHNHTHKTARSEMLYALLVEGQGPYGSTFSRDDFNDNEVRDTDGDGLYEFVDAWGEPLQFYRWPIFYVSDAQKGAGLYQTQQAVQGFSISFETRAQDTLDPNQTLVDPSWWSGGNNATPAALLPFAGMSNTPFGTTSSPLSVGAMFVQSAFHSLCDPNAPAGASQGTTWDRGVVKAPYWARREFYSRHLILSGGPDKVPGVPILDNLYFQALGNNYSTTGTGAAYGGDVILQGGGFVTSGLPTKVAYDIQVESQAAQATPVRSSTIFYSFGAIYNYTGPGNAVTDAVTLAIQDAGSDDISSQDSTGGSGGTLQ